MSPHWHGHYGSYSPMFCRPTRFIWFSIGSLATFALMQSFRKCDFRPTARIGYDDDDDNGRRGHGHGQWERGAGRFQGWGRSGGPRFDEQQQQQQQQWGPRRGAEVPNDDPRSDANGGGWREPPPPVAAEASGRSSTDRELYRLREMGRNAEETISGMSEATIDSMMGGLQRLKERLAERRGQQLQDSQKPLATPPEEPPHPRHRV